MVATQAPFFYFLRVLMVRDQNSNSEFFLVLVAVARVSGAQ